MKMNTVLVKNKKGLTLIELLAVIVILGIIAAIAVPAIGAIINNSRTEADLRSAELIESAAVMWSLDQTPVPATVTVADLVTDGFLAEAPRHQGNDLPFVTVNLTNTNGVVTAAVVVPTT